MISLCDDAALRKIGTLTLEARFENPGEAPIMASHGLLVAVGQPLCRPYRMQEIITDAVVAYRYLASQRLPNPGLLAAQPSGEIPALQIVKHQSPHREASPWPDPPARTPERGSVP